MSKLEQLTVLDSWQREIEIQENYIKQKAAVEGLPLQILEAGCGDQWELKLGDTRYVLTGVDLDKAALENRKTIRNDLDETIEGDLRTVNLGGKAFDVIYSSYVLEHIENAELVLKNFTKWLKPEGIVIVKIPDPNSVDGFVTRLTPHWFHVWYYRNILGMKNAGTPGHGPYRTIYEPVVSRKGIHEFCDDNGLAVKVECGLGYNWPGGSRGIIQQLIYMFKRGMSILSVGALSSRHTNLLYILQKERAI
jgi:2-polyprenyl-3-methyl-5-hydroxy-6-metoxy-1,4-benzoquinol methylase